MSALSSFGHGFQPTPADVTAIISTPSSDSNANTSSGFASERRICPTWTITQLKAKLETMTGIPPGSQSLRLKVPGRQDQSLWVAGEDENSTIGDWGLVNRCEIEVFIFYHIIIFRYDTN